MTRLLATAALTLAATLLTATPADATRVMVPAAHEVDHCWNIRGTQAIWQIGQYAAHPVTRRYRFKLRTPAPGDCRAVRWSR